MKPHELKKVTKQERKIRGKQRVIKKSNKKGEKTIKHQVKTHKPITGHTRR
jgi:hypothetical protein